MSHFKTAVIIGVACLATIRSGRAETIELDAAVQGPVISPLLFGHNLEVTRRAIWSGLGAEMVANRKFAANENGMAKRWVVTGEGTTASLDDQNAYVGKTSLRVNVAAQASGGIVQQQETLCFRKDTRYRFRCWVKTQATRTVRVRVTDAEGKILLCDLEHSIAAGDWRLVTGALARPVLFDEWNTLWGKPGSLGMGLYTAGVLNLLCREADSLNVEQALFFQPVTEGCVTVTPMGSDLDVAGRVFAVFGEHQGNRLLRIAPERPVDADLDLTASLSRDGKQIVVTVINRNPSAPQPLDLLVKNFTMPAEVKATLLTPRALDPQSVFNQSQVELPVTDGNQVSISVPPCSVACLFLEE